MRLDVAVKLGMDNDCKDFKELIQFIKSNLDFLFEYDTVLDELKELSKALKSRDVQLDDMLIWYSGKQGSSGDCESLEWYHRVA